MTIVFVLCGDIIVTMRSTTDGRINHNPHQDHVDQLASHVGVLASLSTGISHLAHAAGVDAASLRAALNGLAPASPATLALCLVALGHATASTG